MQLHHYLKQLDLKVRPSTRLARTTRTIFWKKFRERAKDALVQIERFKSLIQIALQIDQT